MYVLYFWCGKCVISTILYHQRVQVMHRTMDCTAVLFWLFSSLLRPQLGYTLFMKISFFNADQMQSRKNVLIRKVYKKHAYGTLLTRICLKLTSYLACEPIHLRFRRELENDKSHNKNTKNECKIRPEKNVSTQFYSWKGTQLLFYIGRWWSTGLHLVVK